LWAIQISLIPVFRCPWIRRYLWLHPNFFDLNNTGRYRFIIPTQRPRVTSKDKSYNSWDLVLCGLMYAQSLYRCSYHIYHTRDVWIWRGLRPSKSQIRSM
jgi:hypothetical protein